MAIPQRIEVGERVLTWDQFSSRRMPGCPGWSVGWARIGDVIFQRFRHSGGQELLDAMSAQGVFPIVLGVDGVPVTLHPRAGRAWSNEPVPALSPVSQTDGDQVLAHWLEREPIDVPYTRQTGSPRNFFFDPVLVWARRARGCSLTLTTYLHRWVEYQLQRPYQDPHFTGPANALITGTANRPLSLPPYGNTGIWAYDTHHFTIGRLVTAWKLTCSPRALDQILRLLFHALATQDYYKPDWPYAYGGVSRVPGWLFVAFADFLDVVRLAKDPELNPLGVIVSEQAHLHLNRVAELWPHGKWSPFESTDTTGGHAEKLHEVGFMFAVLAFGLARLGQDHGFELARDLAYRACSWLDTFGHDHQLDGVGSFTDVLHPCVGVNPVPGPAPTNGVGMWAVAPLLYCGGRTQWARRFLREARETKFWGWREENYLPFWGRYAEEVGA